MQGVRALLISDRQVTEAFSRLCAVPVTGRRRGGILNITAVAWTAGFQWWRSGDITRTQNVSEYMLVLALYVLALCLVYKCEAGALTSLLFHFVLLCYVMLCFMPFYG